MHYLRLALLPEGPSDYRFLPVVLRRLTLDLCVRLAQRQVEVDEEVADLRALPSLAEDAGSFNILFIHADGGGHPVASRERHFQPWADWISTEPRFESARPVAVVPVREMEAWALADGDALRNAFGAIVTDEELGLPFRPRDVEAIPDPKKSLDDAYATVVGRRRRKKERAVNFLSAIGERIRLERLRQVPAFQQTERDLQNALSELGYFR
jgi:hypothetical protein